MSTRSRIAIMSKGGNCPTYQSIYCHFDSMPEGVGKTLAKYYTTRQKIKRLMKQGDISSLRQEVGGIRRIWQHSSETHSNNQPNAHRNERQKHTRAKKAVGLDHLIAQAQQCFADYLYVWTDRHGWQCLEVPYKD